MPTMRAPFSIFSTTWRVYAMARKRLRLERHWRFRAMTFRMMPAPMPGVMTTSSNGYAMGCMRMDRGATTSFTNTS